MKYDENTAIDYIENFTWSKTRPGLSRTEKLLSLLGNPQNELKFIHIAGSNGKGSASKMLESILICAGYKTGLYTSPYLVDFREQLRINGKMIDAAQLSDIVNTVAPKADSMEDHPSRFEILTAVSFVYFLKNNCDLVVLETGMGGEFDSTNIIPPPLVSIIMNIGLDHTEFLGDTIEEIARTKAGIIKEQSLCVCYDSTDDAVNIIKDVCKQKNVPLKVTDFSKVTSIKCHLNATEFTVNNDESYTLPLTGTHQVRNAMVVLDTVECLNNAGYNVETSHVKQGFLNTNWPARFQVLNKDPLFILDGAHNNQCTKALADTIGDLKKEIGNRFNLLIGVLEDKDYKGMLSNMLPFANKCFLVTPNSPRALSASKLKEIVESMTEINTTVFSDTKDAVKEALNSHTPCLCFGSLYLAGDVIKEYTSIKKSELRNVAKKNRQSLSQREIKTYSGMICDALKNLDTVNNAKTILSYLSTEYEADLSEFDKYATNSGKTVAYPLSYKDGIMEAYSPKGLDSTEIGMFNIRAPIKSKSDYINPKDIDIILLPCVGFDKNLNRLGHGAGYYDRFIPKATNAKLVMVAFEKQKLSDIPAEPYDIKPEICVTESCIYTS